MTQELNYVIFDTAAGWLGILGSVKGLRSITLPQPSPLEARQQLGHGADRATWSFEPFASLAARLRLYFDGHKVMFPDELDLSPATTFQCQVWEATRLIPYCETRSYAWVAAQIGKPQAVRAVGQALGKNPLVIIIPCHRVLKTGGSLGGFGGGLEMKRYLLSLEASARVR